MRLLTFIRKILKSPTPTKCGNPYQAGMVQDRDNPLYSVELFVNLLYYLSKIPCYQVHHTCNHGANIRRNFEYSKFLVIN